MKLFEIMDFRHIKEDVGLEIECEGELPLIDGHKVWKVVHDGSLRNGAEFVFRKPAPVEDVRSHIETLNEIFIAKKAKPSFSFRTSVHVHVNCLGLEYQHILNYIYIYLLLESLLVEYCGEGRKCNRFCLRLEDADGAIYHISNLFARKNGNRAVLYRLGREDKLRYASINVQSLSKFGSLEFRAMRGTINPDILVPWVETLVHIREYAQNFESPRDVFNHLEDVGPREFFKEALGEYYGLFDNGKVEQTIARSQSLSIEIPFIEQREGIVLTKENKDRKYNYGGGVYTLQFLFDHFGGDFPIEVEESILRQDKLREGIQDEALKEIPALHGYNGAIVRAGLFDPHAELEEFDPEDDEDFEEEDEGEQDDW